MREVALVVPACYPDIFAQFLCSQQQYEPDTFCRKILVRDGPAIEPPSDWAVVEGPQPYVMPRNINLGLLAAGRADVLMASDDTQFITPDTVKRLQDAAYMRSKIAVVSPRIDGGCGIVEQQVVKADYRYWAITATRLAFILIYIRRAIIDLIGGWDEQFTSYGHDDFDYCERIRRVGWNLLIADVIVKHGFHSPCMNTYMRKGTADTAEGARIFAEKWGQQ